ncbi:MAG TPA: penicillin-binding protein 1B [Gammaproteobacteria bacterium]|nr:penicillin-binding protein 1B [Gammaproteobacteria bacterium]
MLILLFIAAVPLGTYMMQLSDEITTSFEGRRWAVPARVYSRSMELYAGAPVSRERLVSELEYLGYRKVSQPDTTGTWAMNGGRLLLRSRPFIFWDGAEPEQSLDIRVANGEISSVMDHASGKEIDLVRLEPLEIGSIYPRDNEDRVILAPDDIPEMLKKTLITIEDRSYYDHFGIDPRGITRAAVSTLVKGRREGGSTITQQLVKNYFLTPRRDLKRKSKEALMAIILDAKYEKEDILAAYANEIYLGQDGNREIHGFGLASEFFFGVPIAELEIDQIALMVGLIKAPSTYNPRRNPKNALKRRNLVLDVLAQQGVISEGAAGVAKGKPLGVVKKKPTGQGGRYPAFMDLVKRQLRRDYQPEDLTSEGLRIFTTLDPWVQKTAENNVLKRLQQLEKQKGLPKGKLEVASIIVTPQDGEVLAVIGGRKAGYAGFNRALDATRQIGSLVKPAVYLTALQDPGSYALSTILDDSKVVLRNRGSKSWSPSNYDHKDHGNVPLEMALAKSYNQATVRLGMDVGVDRVVKTLHALGMSSEPDPLPSLLLGAVNMTPLEVTQLYQTIASGGYRSPLRAIREVMGPEDKALKRYPLTIKRTVPAGPVYLLSRAMQSVVTRGTSRYLLSALPKSLNLAGKTGTTDNLRDSWFAGFSSDYVTVVWVGRDDNKPAGLSGSSGALRVWADMMKPLMPSPLDLVVPGTIETAMVDPGSGMLFNPVCGGNGVEKPFLRGYTPYEDAYCDSDYLLAPDPSRGASRQGERPGRGYRDNDGHPDFNGDSWDNKKPGSSKKSNDGLGGFLRSIF